MGEKLNPALAVIIQAAQEQAANTGKIDAEEILKQIAGKYTVEGKEVKRNDGNE